MFRGGLVDEVLWASPILSTFHPVPIFWSPFLNALMFQTWSWKKHPLGWLAIMFLSLDLHDSGKIITTSAEVTLNGGLVRESSHNPLNSGLGITLICPEWLGWWPLNNPAVHKDPVVTRNRGSIAPVREQRLQLVMPALQEASRVARCPPCFFPLVACFWWMIHWCFTSWQQGFIKN